MRAWPLLSLLVGCSPTLGSNDNRNDTGFEAGDDVDPPVLVHDPITESVAIGTDVPISCTATDEGSGVIAVRLYYKNETDASDGYRALQLVASGDTYSGSIPGSAQQSGGMNYYLEAVDASQNLIWSPMDGPSDPYHFRLYVPE